MDCLVNVWQLNTHELHSTMEGHTGAVTCVAISPNSIFAISGSEDKTARVWGLTLGMVVSVFKVSMNFYYKLDYSSTLKKSKLIILKTCDSFCIKENILLGNS